MQKRTIQSFRKTYRYTMAIKKKNPTYGILEVPILNKEILLIYCKAEELVPFFDSFKNDIDDISEVDISDINFNVLWKCLSAQTGRWVIHIVFISEGNLSYKLIAHELYHLVDQICDDIWQDWYYHCEFKAHMMGHLTEQAIGILYK